MYLFIFTSQHVTVNTGALTAAAAASVRIELCVTPLLGHVSALRASKDGDARTAAIQGIMGTDANRNACAKMELPVTMLLENASALLGTLGPCE